MSSKFVRLTSLAYLSLLSSHYLFQTPLCSVMHVHWWGQSELNMWVRPRPTFEAVGSTHAAAFDGSSNERLWLSFYSFFGVRSKNQKVLIARSFQCSSVLHLEVCGPACLQLRRVLAGTPASTRDSKSRSFSCCDPKKIWTLGAHACLRERDCTHAKLKRDYRICI